MSKVRFGTAQRYEFRIRFGMNDLVLKFPDEIASWNKFNEERDDFGDFVREVGYSAVLDTFRVDGPFDLLVAGQDELSLLLPVNPIAFSASPYDFLCSFNLYPIISLPIELYGWIILVV